MARSMLAVALLALLSVAAADRALLSPNTPKFTSSIKGVVFSAGTGTVVADTFYAVSNGNGTWAPMVNPVFGAANVLPASPTNGFGFYYPMSNVYGSTTAGLISAAAPTVNLPLGGLTGITFPSKMLGIAVGAASTVLSTRSGSIPTILITVDQGTTWQAATGFTKSPWMYNIATPVGAAWIAPDLISVTCASRMMCYAVGSYGIAITGTPGVNTPPIFGQVMISSNGGTVWSYVQAATATAPGLPVSVPPGAAIQCTSYLNCPLPGLAGVGADSSGRHVYAVGAPSAPLVVPLATTTGGAVPTQTNNVALSFTGTAGAIVSVMSTTSAGTIIYSGNSGSSWVYQSAAIISSSVYTLTSVTVPRGTIALASGGNPLLASTGGVIVATFNGGFTWVAQSLPTFFNAPSTTAQAALFVYGISHYSKGGNYTVFACAPGGNAMIKTTFPTSATSRNYGTVAWTVVSLPAMVKVGPALLGISWSNNMLGYAYGINIILATRNGGMTWMVETPVLINQAGSGGVYPLMVANVPTSY